MCENAYELGFLDKCESWQVDSRFFPSKVGGKPAWLSLENIPSAEALTCKKCGNIMTFLCQIYAPYDENIEDPAHQHVNNFHRTIFVFICRKPDCCERNNADNIKVFRSCLPRDNRFYPFDPPDENPNTDFTISSWANVCQVCGCLSTKQCSKCKQVYYCTKQHQVSDWKEGHKQECGSESSRQQRVSEKILFPQWEIITEPEELPENDIISEEHELKKFEQLELHDKTGSMREVSEKDLEANAFQNEDKVFRKFQNTIKHDPEQVIRYKRNGEPLWIAQEPLPKNIPNCEHCHGPRKFEFQIMPQLLHALKENSLDWGVIVIYTCKTSCSNDFNYKEEFAFKQDVELN